MFLRNFLSAFLRDGQLKRSDAFLHLYLLGFDLL
jgi:hypothetical protein